MNPLYISAGLLIFWHSSSIDWIDRGFAKMITVDNRLRRRTVLYKEMKRAKIEFWCGQKWTKANLNTTILTVMVEKVRSREEKSIK